MGFLCERDLISELMKYKTFSPFKFVSIKEQPSEVIY